MGRALMGRVAPVSPAGRADRASAAQVCCGLSLAVLVALPAGWFASRPPDAVAALPAEATEATRSPASAEAVAGEQGPTSAAARDLGPRAAARAAVEVPSTARAANEHTPVVPARPARIGEVTATRPPPPTRVRIPVLGLDAPVVPVGVESDGAVAVPEDVGVVGWYRHGPAPGAAAGSAMLAAHVDGPGVAGAFFRLAEVGPGADVAVDTGDGTVHHYRVVARRTVHKDDLPIEAVFADGGPPVLTLVTCGGPFDAATRSYRDNVVVTAVPVPVHDT